MNISRKHRKLKVYHIWQSNLPEHVTVQMMHYFKAYSLSVAEVRYMMHDSWNIHKYLLKECKKL
jgi:hypothetical protein